MRQNQRRVAQRVETILVLLVLGLIWLVARSTAEPLPLRSRERFAVSLATHSYLPKRKQPTNNKLAFSSGANCNARLWEAILTRPNGALKDVERLTWLGCALQVNNTHLRLVRRLTSAVRGSLVLARELRRLREVVSAHVPPHEVKRRKKRIYRCSLLANWLVFNAISFNAINSTVNCTKPVSAQKLALFSKLWNAMTTMAAIKDSPKTTVALWQRHILAAHPLHRN